MDRVPLGRSPFRMRVLARWSALLFSFAVEAPAQWVTESYPLLSGWNAVWVSLDCSHAATIDELLSEGGAQAIDELWLWNPVGAVGRFDTSPSIPLATDAAWQVWRRGNPAESTLTRLVGGAGYLVNVVGQSFTLQLTGRPIPPRYALSGSGQNLVGFPMQTPDSSALRSIERFFSYDAALGANPPVFTYRGGPLSDIAPKNPIQVITPLTTPFSRGRAYWVNTDEPSRYYGPVDLTVLGSTLDFGSTRNSVTIRLRNAIDPGRGLSVTATVAPAPSAEAPAGEAPVSGPVPLLVRGRRDADSLEFTYEALGADGIERTLAPGEQTEVTLAVDRTAMGREVGAVFQSLLHVTDSLNLTRIDLGVRAEVPSFTGIWIGDAVVNKVDQIIGQGVEEEAEAPSGFPLRLILHRSDAGAVTVLQQVHLGSSGESLVAGPDEASVTAASDGQVVRFSSASFPPGQWEASDDIGLSGEVTFSVVLGHDAATNPFKHAYHPDHDNLDSRFEKPLPPGVESPRVDRAVKLTFLPELPGLNDNGFGSTTLGGTYEETITGLRSTPITVSGTFVLRRVAPTPDLMNPVP